MVIVVLLVASLSTSVGAGNAAIAAERTVLSGPYVKATLAETGAYEEARDIVVRQVTAQAGPRDEGSGTPSPFGEATGRIVEEAVTETYMQREVERNVDSTYGYLHGDREELVVAVDLARVQDEIVEILAAEIRNASVAELMQMVGFDDGNVRVGGIPLNVTAMGAMAESPAAYEAARADFRADVRESIVRELVDQSFDEAGNDERLALVISDYDPDAYSDAEKAEMVDAREAEIRTAIAQRIEAERGEEIDVAVEEQLEKLAAVDRDQLATQLGGSDDETTRGLVIPIADIAATSLRALATDVPYETYVEETDDAKARLAANASVLIEGQIQAEGTDRLVLADSRNPEVGPGLERARMVVGLVDLASILLPLVALALVGALWWLTRSPAVTTGGAGVGLLVGGLPGYVLAVTTSDLLAETLASGALPGDASELILGLVDRVLGVLASQSLTLSATGLLLVTVAAYVHLYGTPTWALRDRQLEKE